MTKGEQKLLLAMLQAEEADRYEDAELIRSIPGGWWLGEDEVSGKICMSLLRKCLLREESGSRDNYFVYTLNSDGRAAARDKNFVSTVTKHLVKHYESTVKLRNKIS